MFGAAPFGAAPFGGAFGPTSTAYSASLAQGSYVLTGQSLTVRIARTVQLARGSYTLAGQSIQAIRGKSAILETGFYTLSGQALTVHAHLSAQLTQGSYTLSGQPMTATLVTVPHHYRVRDDAQPQYLADLAVEPLYLITDGFAAKYRVDDIAEESD